MDFNKLEDVKVTKKPVKKQASSVKKSAVKEASDFVIPVSKNGVFYKSVFQTCVKCDKSVVHIFDNGFLKCADCGNLHQVKELDLDKSFKEIKSKKEMVWVLLF